MKQTAPDTSKISGTLFLASVLVIYAVSFVLHPDRTVDALGLSVGILLKLLPILVIVIILLGVFNFFFHAKKFSKQLEKTAGIKVWLLALAGGVISHGPSYIWYPMLSELHRHGVREGLIVTFFYARAIKLPLLPIMIDYFGLAFTGILLFYILIASIVQGLLTDLVYEVA